MILYSRAGIFYKEIIECSQAGASAHKPPPHHLFAIIFHQACCHGAAGKSVFCMIYHLLFHSHHYHLPFSSLPPPPPSSLLSSSPGGCHAFLRFVIRLKRKKSIRCRHNASFFLKAGVKLAGKTVGEGLDLQQAEGGVAGGRGTSGLRSRSRLRSKPGL